MATDYQAAKVSDEEKEESGLDEQQ